MEPKLPKLIVFDADGTLRDRDTGEILAGVREYFDLVFHSGCRNRPQMAIASNQGGVGLRYWMESAGFGEPVHYPTQDEAEEGLDRLAEDLAGDHRIHIYVAFAYQSKSSGEWSPAPSGRGRDMAWNREWRKPAPGMLQAAMADAGVSPAQTLMIGDRPEDREAAAAAGCAFQWAQKFFGRGWGEGEDYGLLR